MARRWRGIHARPGRFTQPPPAPAVQATAIPRVHSPRRPAHPPPRAGRFTPAASLTARTITATGAQAVTRWAVIEAGPAWTGAEATRWSAQEGPA